MHQSAWQKEILRISVVTGLGLSLGWSVGYPLIGLMAGLLISLSMLLRAMSALYRWSYRQGPPPQDSGLVGYSVDKLRRREKNLKGKLAQQAKQLRRYNQGIESLHDGVVIIDQDGHISGFNGSAARLLGLRPEDAGQPVTNLIRVPRFTRYFNNGDYSEALQFDVTQRTTISLQVQITQFGLDQKVMLIKDITERKRVETMRQNFIADVSHELRTPLTVINGYLEMLEDMDLPAPVKRATSQMNNQGLRMKDLVNDLIQLSKLESAATDDMGDWFDLSRLGHSVVDQVRSLAGDRIRFHSPVTCEIQGFAEEMNSVLTNLLTNAVKYGGDGTIDFAIESFGDSVKVSVRDHGPGIPPEHIGHLTERFYRVDDSRESSVGGSGLGLAIVKHALEHHDTALDIESTLGKGSTFSFIISPERSRLKISASA